jgi:hypothetical protein
MIPAKNGMDAHEQYFVADDNHVLINHECIRKVYSLTALQYAASYSAGGGVSEAGGWT